MKDKKLLHLYKLLQELTEEEKQLKQQVRQSEAEVTGTSPWYCQSWSGVLFVLREGDSFREQITVYELGHLEISAFCLGMRSKKKGYCV